MNWVDGYRFGRVKRKKVIWSSGVNDGVNGLILGLNGWGGGFVVVLRKKLRMV